jgi:hypothetical protein
MLWFVALTVLFVWGCGNGTNNQQNTGNDSTAVDSNATV